MQVASNQEKLEGLKGGKKLITAAEKDAADQVRTLLSCLSNHGFLTMRAVGDACFQAQNALGLTRSSIIIMADVKSGSPQVTLL